MQQYLLLHWYQHLLESIVLEFRHDFVAQQYEHNFHLEFFEEKKKWIEINENQSKWRKIWIGRNFPDEIH